MKRRPGLQRPMRGRLDPRVLALAEGADQRREAPGIRDDLDVLRTAGHGFWQLIDADTCGTCSLPSGAPVHAVEDRPVAARSVALDALRGLAVLCMVVDHLAIFWGPAELRWSVGRVAMPLFFVLAGHLSRRLSWRLLGVLAVGLLLPGFAGFIDDPNVLVWYVFGAVSLAAVRRLRVPPWVLVAFALTTFANPSVFQPYAEIGTGYPPFALWGLMALGACLGRGQLEFLDRWPARVTRPLAWVGRYPLSVYAGHVLLLAAVVAASGAVPQP